MNADFLSNTPKQALESAQGWDIVLGNPPYIGEKGNKDIFEKIKMIKEGYEERMGDFYQGKMDYFYFFFHRALNLLSPNGILSFITTNYFSTANGAKKLREDLRKRAFIKYFINFNEHKVFKSAQGQHNAIFILQKASQGEAKIYNFIQSAQAENLSKTLRDKTMVSFYETSNLYEGAESYMRLGSQNSALESIFHKLTRDSSLLGAICAINQGIVSGADKVTQQHLQKYDWEKQGIKKDDGIYIVSDEVENLGLESPYLKPWFKNSDIDKYTAKAKTSQYVLYLTGEENPQVIPNILKHLERFKANLQERREVHKGSRPWWSLWRSRKQKTFETAKIVAPQRSKNNTFGYNEISWYASADVYFITLIDSEFSLKYILALLNSKLYYFWLYHKGKRKGENLELYQTPLSEIPIKPISLKEQEPFIALVDEIISLKTKDSTFDTSHLESEIDSLAYELYGLNDEEIQIIEGGAK